MASTSFEIVFVFSAFDSFARGRFESKKKKKPVFFHFIYFFFFPILFSRPPRLLSLSSFLAAFLPFVSCWTIYILSAFFSRCRQISFLCRHFLFFFYSKPSLAFFLIFFLSILFYFIYFPGSLFLIEILLFKWQVGNAVFIGDIFYIKYIYILNESEKLSRFP